MGLKTVPGQEALPSGVLMRLALAQLIHSLAARGATRYTSPMVRSFRHKGVERFFRSGSRAGIQAAHAPRLGRQLSALDAAKRPEDMNRPGWDWHPLKGSLSGHWSVSVNGNWRLTFSFENGDAVLVDYQDYH